MGALGMWAFTSCLVLARADAHALVQGRADARGDSRSGRDEAHGRCREAVEDAWDREAQLQGRIESLEGLLLRAREPLASIGSGSLAAIGSGSLSRPLDADALALRLAAIEGEIAVAADAKDGKRLVALYAELLGYGKGGWPLAARIGAVFFASDDADLGLGKGDIRRAMLTNDATALYVDAIANPDPYDRGFRCLAIQCLSTLGCPSDLAPALVAAFRTETDLTSLQLIGGILASNPPPGSAAAFMDLLAQPGSQDMRNWLARYLMQIPGAEATQDITTLAATEQDPQLAAALAQNLQARQTPVPGYLVTNVLPLSGADQAGLQPNDIVTSANNQPLTNWRQLQRLEVCDPSGQPIVYGVWRNGQTFTVTLKGRLWQNGASGSWAIFPNQ